MAVQKVRHEHTGLGAFWLWLLVTIALASLIGFLASYNIVWAYGLIAGCVYFFILLRSVWTGFLLFMLYSVVHLWLSVGLGIFPTYTDDVLFYLLVAVSGLRLFFSRAALLRLYRVRGYVGLYILYLFYQVVSVLVAGGMSGVWGMREFVQFSILPLLVLAVVNEGRAQQAYRWLIYAAVVVACLAPVGALWPISGLSSIGTRENQPDMLRVTSTMGNPNTLAHFLGFVTLCYLPKFVFKMHWRKVAILSMFILTILMSLSRSAVVLIPAFVALEWVLYLKFDGQLQRIVKLKIQRRWIHLILGLILTGIITVFLIMPSLGKIPDLRTGRISLSRILDKESLLRPRISLWTSVLSHWQSNWLFGSGVGSVTGRTALTSSIQTVDSYWLKILLEQGVLGLLLMLGLLYNLGRRAWRMCSEKTLQNAGIASVVAIAYIVVAGTFMTIFDVYPLNLFLWSGMGFLLFLDTARTGGI